jgi:hypothetical protein
MIPKNVEMIGMVVFWQILTFRRNVAQRSGPSRRHEIARRFWPVRTS